MWNPIFIMYKCPENKDIWEKKPENYKAWETHQQKDALWVTITEITYCTTETAQCGKNVGT
jgi:hypothetical protein